MKKIIGPLLALFFFFSASATAVAPTKPQEIPSFEFKPVTTDSLDIRDTWLHPSPSLLPRPKKQKRPELIVKNLTPPAPVVHTHAGLPSVADAKAYALSVLGPDQYYCIDQIFIHESHWNPYDLNPSSGAYGIPQAVPGSKMAVIASDWRTNPITQVKWGIRYVNGRYGSACKAWAFWINNRWY